MIQKIKKQHLILKTQNYVYFIHNLIILSYETYNITITDSVVVKGLVELYKAEPKIPITFLAAWLLQESQKQDIKRKVHKINTFTIYLMFTLIQLTHINSY